MVAVRTVLVVEDEADLMAMLAGHLEAQDDMRVIRAATGAEALRAMRESRPDITLLDVGLPDMDGYDVLRDARRAGVTEPVLILTGHTGEVDHERGFAAGAEDYVEKPFSFAKLTARMRSLLRRHLESTSAELCFGNVRFSPSARTVAVDGGLPVRLTDKESKILHRLWKAGDSSVPRDVLLGEVWGYGASVKTHTIETHVYRLRQKLEAGQGCVIRTESDGYRLEAVAA